MGKKILLADDSITIQKVIELTFSDEDFEVVTVGNGRLAIERVQDVRPDVVLCDIIMPEKDGYEVCDFIKRHPQLGQTPVLLLTGAFEPFDQERAARVGSDGFLAKPFEPQTLIAKVKDLLAQSGAKRGGVTPSRPVAAAAAAAPTPPPMPPFGRPQAAPPAPPAAAAPVLEEEPGTSPAGIVSPFVRPRPEAEPPPAPAPPVEAPVPSLGSEFEVFYPTPEEIEPLAASPEFEPVFAPSDFEPVEAPTEYDTLEVPVVELPEAAPAMPPAWRQAEPAAPSFISDEPFVAEPEPVVEPAPPLAVRVEPEPEPPIVRWSEPTHDVPLEERAQASVAAAYGVPVPPPTFEESFEEPALTLEPEDAAAPAPAPMASAPAGPDELVSEALFDVEPEEPPAEMLAPDVAPYEVAAPSYEPEPPLEPVTPEAEAPEAGLFTALVEEGATREPLEVEPLPAEMPEPTFSRTEPALTLGEAELEPGALELEPEVEAEAGPLATEDLVAESVPPEPMPAVPFAMPAEPEPVAMPEPMAPPPVEAAPVVMTEPPSMTPTPTPTPVFKPAFAAAAPVSEVVPVPEEVSFEGLAPAPPAEAPVAAPGAAAVAVPMEMVEQIARRVVAQLGDKVIREVAWEVVPDLAEVLIRREIERLKAELDRLP